MPFHLLWFSSPCLHLPFGQGPPVLWWQCRTVKHPQTPHPKSPSDCIVHTVGSTFKPSREKKGKRESNPGKFMELGPPTNLQYLTTTTCWSLKVQVKGFLWKQLILSLCSWATVDQAPSLLSSVPYLQNWSNFPAALMVSHLFPPWRLPSNLQPTRAKFNTPALNKDGNQQQSKYLHTQMKAWKQNYTTDISQILMTNT